MYHNDDSTNKISKLEFTIVAAVFLLAGVGIVYHPSLPVFIGEFNSVDGSIYAATLVYVVASLTLFLFVAYRLMPEFVGRKGAWSVLFKSIGLLVTLALVKQWADHQLLVMWNLPTDAGSVSDKMLDYVHCKTVNLNTAPLLLGVYSVGVAYGLVRTRRLKARLDRRIAEEKMEADVKLLRSQINPHFFFNALNNIYAVALRNDDDETARAILTLSTMMRFWLYESDSEEIAINKEIDQIENIIEIARLKYPKTIQPDIRLTAQVSNRDSSIAPLLLVPFVENALKHGLTAEGEGYLDITIKCWEDELDFRVENSKNVKSESLRSHSGIGLQNVRRRLALLYPNRHTLTIDDSNVLFKIELRLNLGK